MLHFKTIPLRLQQSSLKHPGKSPSHRTPGAALPERPVRVRIAATPTCSQHGRKPPSHFPSLLTSSPASHRGRHRPRPQSLPKGGRASPAPRVDGAPRAARRRGRTAGRLHNPGLPDSAAAPAGKEPLGRRPCPYLRLARPSLPARSAPRSAPNAPSERPAPAAPAKVENGAAQSATPPPKQAGGATNENARSALIPPPTLLATPLAPTETRRDSGSGGAREGAGTENGRGQISAARRAGQGMCGDKG